MGRVRAAVARRTPTAGRGRPAARALLAVTALATVALAAAGCGSNATPETDAEITAVATTGHAADLVRNVGGDRVEVVRLLRPGSDPHDYEPRPSDVQAIAEAALVVRSGGDLDAWLAGALDSAGGDARRLTLIDQVDALEAEGGVDPHWWQDPRNAVRAVETIAQALARVDPEGAGAYRENAERYGRRLRRLDRAIARCMDRVPEGERKLVTTHDSYAYFARRYGVEVIGALIPSRSTQAQPSAGETARLVEQIQAEGVEAIFPESPVDPDLERAVAGETGAVVADPLWADSLGPEGSGGATYVEALASDARAMVEGFTGGARSCPALPGS